MHAHYIVAKCLCVNYMRIGVCAYVCMYMCVSRVLLIVLAIN